MSQRDSLVAILKRYQALCKHYLELTNQNHRFCTLLLELREALSHEINELKTAFELSNPLHEQVETLQQRYHPTSAAKPLRRLQHIVSHLERVIHDVELHSATCKTYYQMSERLSQQVATTHQDSPQLMEKLQRNESVLVAEVAATEQRIHEMRMILGTFFQTVYEFNLHTGGEHTLLHNAKHQPHNQEHRLTAEELPAHVNESIGHYNHFESEICQHLVLIQHEIAKQLTENAHKPSVHELAIDHHAPGYGFEKELL